MNEAQRENWARTRQRGAVRFVLDFMLACGVSFGLIYPSLLKGLNWLRDSPPSRYSFLEFVSWGTPVGLVFGLVSGVFVWCIFEREFNRVLKVPPWWAILLSWMLLTGVFFMVVTTVLCGVAMWVLELPPRSEDPDGIMSFVPWAWLAAGLVDALIGFLIGRRHNSALYSPDKSEIPPEVS